MNRFFDGEFMTFGLDVIRHMEADQEDRMDPMIYIFPRMTKCTFYKYGVSGEVRNQINRSDQPVASQFTLSMIINSMFSICRWSDMMQFVYFH